MTRYIFVSIFLFFISFSNLLAQEQLNKTLIHDGNMREYTVYIPASYQEGIPIPLLFNFHGGSGNISSQIAIADMRSIADSDGFVLVYPQAWPDPSDGGSTNWTHKAPTNHDDIYFVEAMIDELSLEYTIDQKRVYACGYSNGGEFSFELACRLSDRIAAIGVVARSMYIDTYNNCSPTHPTPVLTIHGTEDDYEGIIWAGTTYYVSLDDVNTYWSEINQTDSSTDISTLPNTNTNDGSTVEHHIWANGDGCVSVEHLKVIGGGHDWPGSFGNMDIDASTEIWNFVSKYNKDGLLGCGSTSVQGEVNKPLNLILYPNPSVYNITVVENTFSNQSYHIYSIDGTLVLYGTLSFDNKSIDISTLRPNVYIVKIEDKVSKFIKTD